MRVTLVGLVAVMVAGPAVCQVADTPAKLLDLAGKTQGKEARRRLGQVVSLLGEGKMTRTREEMDSLATRLAQEVEKCAKTPREVLEIFGEKTPKAVARQVFFRRYYEQWVFDQPVRIVVVFDCIKGKEAKLLSLFVPEREN
jgi:hypothetical protein